MLFSEPAFLFLFLPALLWGYFLCPKALKNLLLVFASLFFYAWGEMEFVAVMLGSIAFNYGIGLRLDRAAAHRRAWLAAGILGNLALLGTFKYANFVIENINGILTAIGADALDAGNIRLPLGISFFTFQSMSYVIDVYRGTSEVQKNPVRLALYIALFPQLIAGPIVRYGTIAAQIAERTVTWGDFDAGVRRFILGLGKKMIIANTMAYPADMIFGLPAQELTPTLAWMGILCYTLQIYYDFSGYSDMAIGLGRMFGFTFPENFNYPYVCKSISEFWRRWHLTLSSWFRDYLYIPMGGSRCSSGRVYFNLFTVFFLCGLWHGAGWPFIVWGIYQGLLLVLERGPFGKRMAALPTALQHGYALLLVVIGWVIFRADTLGQGVFFLRTMLLIAPEALPYRSVIDFMDWQFLMVFPIAILGAMPVYRMTLDALSGIEDSGAPVSVFAARFAHTIFLAAVLLYSLLLAASGTYSPFIYFRF